MVEILEWLSIYLDGATKTMVAERVDVYCLSTVVLVKYKIQSFGYRQSI